MSRDFVGALLQLNAEKGVPREQLVRTVEDAIQSAYRRVAPGYEDVFVRLDIDTGQMRVFRARSVVAEVEDATTEWDLDEAQAHEPEATLGDLVEYEELDADPFRSRRRPDRGPGRAPAPARGRAGERSSTSSRTARARSSPARSAAWSRAA